MSRIVGAALGKIFPSPRDDPYADMHLFTRHEYFARCRKPNMIVEAPDYGESGSRMAPEIFPSLRWNPPPNPVAPVREYLVIVEDLDVPVTYPHWHGAFYGLPHTKTSMDQADLRKVAKGTFERQVTGGFKYTPIGRGTGNVWIAPKPLKGSGPHRIYFQIIAVKETVDKRELSQFPTKSSFYGLIEGKIVGWGEWIGVVERK